MQAHPVLDPRIPFAAYREVDFSIENSFFGQAPLDLARCQAYLRDALGEVHYKVGWGGYLERRNLYRDFQNFNPGAQQAREYHLGIDFWADAGTSVHAPWAGTIHSWADRAIPGDYGPVILILHKLPDREVVSLYGHLSRNSLGGLHRGKPIARGELIGYLGTPEENGGYAPHLHFQLIHDLQGHRGDYPGVCSRADLDYYRQNCPDPMPLLGYF